jgi:outer membrane immunogenic protein
MRSFVTTARLTLAAATLAALAGSATAADLGARAPAPYYPPPPPPPVFSWSSCYIGGNIGGGWASHSSNDVTGAVTGVVGADLGSHTASGFVVNSNIPWLATVTGRIGVTAAPTVLVYAKGGGAWVRDNYTVTAVPGIALGSASSTPSGWTVGGGVEWAFAGNWTAFAEYNYLDFGTPGVNFTPAVGAATFPINIKQNINSFMVGINYRFGAIGY